MTAASPPQCPRCARPVTPGVRTCPACGFDLTWDQGLAATASIPSGAFMTTVGLEVADAPMRPMELLRKVCAGEYDVLGILGRGGMATVYLARDLALDRKVAIKVISPQFLDGPEAVERFKREARTAASLSHPGIIPIYNVREHEDVLFFVMKHVDGRTLAAILESHGPLPIAAVRVILASVANALDHANRNGVVHRDVKPGNIMVDTEGHVVITDFGIAKVADVQGLTQAGRTMGTPTYMSPEACRGRGVAGASDQYSLGVVGYELLVGRNPFISDSAMSTMYAQIHEVPQAIRELRPDCPPDLADAVTRMLEKEPENRWPSLKDAAAGVMGTAQVGPDTVAVLSQLAGQGPERRDGSPGSGSAPIPRRTPISAQVARTGSRPLLWFFAIGILVLAPLLWYLTHQASGRPSDTPPTAGDSAVASARAGAIAARVRARAAGLPASAIAPGDSVQAAAESMAVAGRQLEAAALFTTAADLWDSVLKSRSGIARPDSGARVAGPAPPPEPVSDSGALASYYETLAQAIESKQLGEVRRLLPNLTDFEVGAWRRLFEDRNVEAIDASYAILSFRSDGATATARVSSRLVVTKKGKPEAKEHPYYATLTKGPDGWREIRQEN